MCSSREAVCEHLLAGGRGQREGFDLVKRVALDPLHAPEVEVRVAVAAVHDAFHGVVVVDPGLADVVAHGLGHVRGRNLQQRGEMAGRVGMKPHEDRDPIGGLATESGVDALA